MASSTNKRNINGQSYWYFSFSNKRRDPRQKQFTFSADKHKKSEVDHIRDTLERKYRAGEWDPWTQPVPGLQSSGVNDIQLHQAVDQLGEYIPGKYAKNTIDSINSMMNLLKKEFGNVYLSRISTDQLNGWVNDALSYHSRRTRKDRLKVLIRFCNEKGYIDHINIEHIKAFGSREEKKTTTRRVIKEGQMLSMLDALDRKMKKVATNPKVSLRRIRPAYQKRKDIIMVMFYMGLRLDEVIHTRPAWIVDNFRFLRIGDLKRWRLPDEFHPKSKKETDDPIAIPAEVVDIFKRRIGLCNGLYDRLFGMRSRSHVQKGVKQPSKDCKDIDYENGISPHDLRHSCVSYWLNDRGVPVQEVQNLVRHEDIKTTMTYFHPDKEAHYRAFHGGRMIKMDGAG